MCAIKIDWKIVSLKNKNIVYKKDIIKSNIWKKVRWIWEELSLYEWTILKEIEERYLIYWFNRNKINNPDRNFEEILVNKMIAKLI
jgi:hypothetical protein